MSDFDSTEEFCNESDNWESAEDISENDSQKSADSDSDLGEIESQFEPYTEEPLAPPDYMSSGQEESDDPDRLSPQSLADREEGLIPVQNWSVKFACCEFIVVIVAYRVEGVVNSFYFTSGVNVKTARHRILAVLY